MSSAHRNSLLVAIGLACALVFGACTPKHAEPAGDRYVVRGVVREVQVDEQLDSGPRRMRIQHEAIDSLVGVDGAIEPMMAMTMSLVLADATEVPTSLAEGDKIRFVLDVDWARSPTALVVEIERLDPGTELAVE